MQLYRLTSKPVARHSSLRIEKSRGLIDTIEKTEFLNAACTLFSSCPIGSVLQSNGDNFQNGLTSKRIGLLSRAILERWRCFRDSPQISLSSIAPQPEELRVYLRSCTPRSAPIIRYGGSETFGAIFKNYLS